MKPKYWGYLFIAVTCFYFLGLALNHTLLLFLFKPLLITSLLGYFLKSTSDVRSHLKKWMIGALLGSITGDTLLMFSSQSEIYFLAGLIAFLIAHICYIITFHSIRTQEAICGKWYLGIIVSVYYLMILGFLMPHLGTMKYPVIIYGLVISFMLLLAMHLYDLKDNITARYILTGAILFVVSDSVLAVNKFYLTHWWNPWIIMSTYILAQWLLVRGCIRYINNKAAV